MVIEFVLTRLSYVTVDQLCVFLINNYVRECARLCPDYIQELMNDVDTVTQLENALSSIVDWRFECYLEQSCTAFAGILSCGQRDIRKTRPAHLPVYRQFIELLQEVDGRLVDHFIALIFLHFTELVEQEQDNFEILKVIDELMKCNQTGVDLHTKIHMSSSNTSFSGATDLLIKLHVEVNTDTMLRIELAKALFHMSIDNNDVDQEHEDGSARIHLASLYYSTKQY